MWRQRVLALIGDRASSLQRRNGRNGERAGKRVPATEEANATAHQHNYKAHLGRLNLGLVARTVPAWA